MVMQDTMRLFRFEDLDTLPDDGKRREVFDGVLVEMDPAKPNHYRLARLIANLLDTYVSEHGLGIAEMELGCVLGRDPLTLVIPDVGYLSRARYPSMDRNEYPDVAPDLAVEIISPTDRAGAVRGKTKHYLEAGTQMSWVFYPEREEVHVIEAGVPNLTRVAKGSDVFDAGAVIPGFRLDLSPLFAALRPLAA